MNTKYGIMNLTAACEPYTYFDSIKQKYYANKKIPYKQIYNEPIIRNLAENEMLYVSDCTHPSGIPAMLEKFIWASRLLLEDPEWNTLDFIIRTNSSTFINLEVLEPILETLPKKRCYAGSIVFNRFISGTCIIFSLDVIRYLAKIKINSKDKESYDDVALSRYMDKRLIRKRNVPMCFFIDNVVHDSEKIAKILNDFPLVRIKNDADRHTFDLDLWNKIAIIKNIN